MIKRILEIKVFVYAFEGILEHLLLFPRFLRKMSQCFAIFSTPPPNKSRPVLTCFLLENWLSFACLEVDLWKDLAWGQGEQS